MFSSHVQRWRLYRIRMEWLRIREQTRRDALYEPIVERYLCPIDLVITDTQIGVRLKATTPKPAQEGPNSTG